ncbi:MAG: outer membrane beta-barrel protein [Planctomycetaceae bacterium]
MVEYLLIICSLMAGQAEPPAPSEDMSVVEASEPTAESTEPEAVETDDWFLMKSLPQTQSDWLHDNRMLIYGWTEASFTASSADNSQLPMGFNYRANDFMLQQNWLRLERSIDTDATDPSFGFLADVILPGNDYRFTMSRGLMDHQLTDDASGPERYGIDPVQFYADFYFPSIAQGLDIKVGRMFCQYGVETIHAPPNALASHSYTFIYDPFTHTGVVATLQLNDDWSTQAGAVMGPDVFIDPAASPYGMFSVKWAPPEGSDSVLIAGMLGSGEFDFGEQFNNPNIIDLVYTHALNSELSYSLDALYGYQTDVPGIGIATWFGVVNYLTYKFSDDVSGTTRLEFFDDVDGNRTGAKGLYTALTAGLNWQVQKAIILRPEVRYDNNNKSQPFEGSHDLFTAAVDVIVRW